MTSGGEHRRIMADAGKLSGATAAAYFFNLIGGYIIARILAPGLYGVWKTIQLTLQYTQLANLGMHYGLGKVCPPLASRQCWRRYRALMGVSLGYSLSIPGIAAIGVFGAALLSPPGPARVGLLALAVLLPMQQFNTHADIALTIEKQFGIKAILFFLYTITRVALCVILGYSYGLAGALTAFIVSHALASYVMWRYSHIGFAPHLRWSMASRLVRIALPITCLAGGELVLATADKWVVAAILGSQAMGLYQMAIMPLPFLTLLPTAMRQVVATDVYDRFGRTGRLGDCRAIFERSILVLTLCAPVFIGMVFFGAPWLIYAFLPAYHGSIGATQFHAILIYPLLVTQTCYSIFVVTHREPKIYAAQAAISLVCAAASVNAAAWLRQSFLLVLNIHAAGWVIYGIGLLAAAQRLFGERTATALLRAARWHLPMIYIAIEMPLLHWAGAKIGLTPYTFLHASLCGLAHIAACAPFLLHLERRTGAISETLRSLRRRLGYFQPEGE